MTSASAAVCVGGDSRKKEIKLKGTIRSHTSNHYADNSKGTTAMDRHFEECKKAEDFLPDPPDCWYTTDPGAAEARSPLPQTRSSSPVCPAGQGVAVFRG